MPKRILEQIVKEEIHVVGGSNGIRYCNITLTYAVIELVESSIRNEKA